MQKCIIISKITPSSTQLYYEFENKLILKIHDPIYEKKTRLFFEVKSWCEIESDASQFNISLLAAYKKKERGRKTGGFYLTTLSLATIILVVDIYEMLLWINAGIILAGKNCNVRKKTCPSANLNIRWFKPKDP
jgi:hypothetical protein